MATIVLQGDGIAALTCGHLLQSAGFGVSIERAPRAYLPALMVSASSQALFRDVLELRDAFSSLPRIQKRVVKWGPQPEPVALPHSAVIASEQFLLEMVAKLFRANASSPEAADWTIISSRPLPESVIEHGFGSQVATVTLVELEKGSDSTACWIESLEDGWLFLMPDAPGSGWLISVGGPLNAHLNNSRMIAGQIRGLGDGTREFPSYPRITWPLCGPHCLWNGGVGVRSALWGRYRPRDSGSDSRFGGRACRCPRHKRERAKRSLSSTAGDGLQASPGHLPRVLSIGRSGTLVGFYSGVSEQGLEMVRPPTQQRRRVPVQATWAGTGRNSGPDG